MFKKTVYLGLLLLTACAQSPTTQYYRLPDSVFRQPENHHEQKTKIIRVELDEGLSDNALMYQTSETNVHYTHHHRWASRLNQDIANTLANAANQRGHHALYLPVLSLISSRRLTLKITYQSWFSVPISDLSLTV